MLLFKVQLQSACDRAYVRVILPADSQLSYEAKHLHQPPLSHSLFKASCDIWTICNPFANRSCLMSRIWQNVGARFKTSKLKLAKLEAHFTVLASDAKFNGLTPNVVFIRVFPMYITGSFVYVDTLISYYKHQILQVSQCSSLRGPSAYTLNQPPLPLAKSPMARCISSFSITARCKLDFALVCLAFTDDRAPTSAEGAEDDTVSWSAFMDVKWGATIIGVRRGGGGHCNKNHVKENC